MTHFPISKAMDSSWWMCKFRKPPTHPRAVLSCYNGERRKNEVEKRCLTSPKIQTKTKCAVCQIDELWHLWCITLHVWDRRRERGRARKRERVRKGERTHLPAMVQWAFVVQINLDAHQEQACPQHVWLPVCHTSSLEWKLFLTHTHTHRVCTDLQAADWNVPQKSEEAGIH